MEHFQREIFRLLTWGQTFRAGHEKRGCAPSLPRLPNSSLIPAYISATLNCSWTTAEIHWTTVNRTALLPLEWHQDWHEGTKFIWLDSGGGRKRKQRPVAPPCFCQSHNLHCTALLLHSDSVSGVGVGGGWGKVEGSRCEECFLW